MHAGTDSSANLTVGANNPKSEKFTLVLLRKRVFTLRSRVAGTEVTNSLKQLLRFCAFVAVKLLMDRDVTAA